MVDAGVVIRTLSRVLLLLVGAVVEAWDVGGADGLTMVVGAGNGEGVGNELGVDDGKTVGRGVGSRVGATVGVAVGAGVSAGVGVCVGADVGRFERVGEVVGCAKTSPFVTQKCSKYGAERSWNWAPFSSMNLSTQWADQCEWSCDFMAHNR